MNKFKKYKLLFLLFFLLSCAYKPILNSKNYQFSLNVIKVDGDQKIGSLLTNNFKNLKEERNQYDLTLSSLKKQNIISKDSKGDPLIFELLISVNYEVKKNEKILMYNEINKKTTYNNIADKFELESYEKTIINNLVKNISDSILSSISELNE